jgi:hypothetical protein
MATKLHKPAAKPAPAEGEQGELAARFPWSPTTRAAASVLLALHVAAVFIAPWSMPPPASQLSNVCARCFRPYMLGTAQYNGYRFFAPNPGPSHVVRYELELENGDLRRGRFPDVKQHQPRLLYHRHFMIAERCHELSNRTSEPPAPPPEVPPRWRPRVQAEYDSQREAYAKITADEAARQEKLVRPIAARLLRQHNAKRIRLWSVEHAIPSPLQVVEGMPLDDEGLYHVRPWRLLGDYTRDELAKVE